MAIQIKTGSGPNDWTTVSPQIKTGSGSNDWTNVNKGEIYTGSGWSTFYQRFSGTTTAPSLSFNSSTLYTVTINVSMNVAPAAGYTARVAVWNYTTGSAINAQYIPNLSGTTGTISGTFVSTGLSLDTSYQFAAYTEYLQGGVVVASSSTVYFNASTRNVVLPTITISSKTDTSITVNITHSDSLARRVVVYRGGTGGPDTRYNPSSTTYSSTSTINWTQTFSSLSSNVRYFFYAYVVYSEGTTTTSEVSTFTKTKWWSPQSSGYVAGNNSAISDFAAHALYLSDTQSGMSTGVNSWFSGQEPEKASDGSNLTQWKAFDIGLQTITTTETRTIGNISASRNSFSGFFNEYTTTTGHGLTTSTSATVTMSSIRYPISSITTIDAGGSVFRARVVFSVDIPALPSGTTISIVGNSNSVYNDTFTVFSSDTTNDIILLNNTPGTLNSKTSSGTGGRLDFGSTYRSLYNAGPANPILIGSSTQFSMSDTGGVDLPLTVATGQLSYSGTSSEFVTKASSGTASSLQNAERLIMGFKPNLPSSTTRNVYLEAVRFRVGTNPTSYLALSINGGSTLWNAADSGGVDRIPVISQNTIQPTASYLANGVAISNCFTFRFDMQRISATCSMTEVQISYKYQELTDPGD